MGCLCGQPPHTYFLAFKAGEPKNTKEESKASSWGREKVLLTPKLLDPKLSPGKDINQLKRGYTTQHRLYLL
jgi:hypothetical protein